MAVGGFHRPVPLSFAAPARNAAINNGIMEQGDYIAAWSVYLIGAAVFSALAWRVLRRLRWRELAILLQAWLLALLLTPARVLPDQDIFAPALMVFVLDSLTIEPVAGIRALIPLVLALFAAAVAAALLAVGYRVHRRRQQAKAAQ
jgi:hypothetical protein